MISKCGHPDFVCPNFGAAERAGEGEIRESYENNIQVNVLQ